MPRVTYESSRFLALPDAWPSSGGSLRLPRGRSAGTLGGPLFGGALAGFPQGHAGHMVHAGHAAHASPATTPLEEKALADKAGGAAGMGGFSAGQAPGSGTPAVLTCAPNSRRSSLSPSDRGRRRDSPACLLVEVPPWQRSVLTLIEEWMRESHVDLERNAPLCRELRDFQAKVQACGPPYQQWCAELRAEFPALVSRGKN